MARPSRLALRLRQREPMRGAWFAGTLIPATIVMALIGTTSGCTLTAPVPGGPLRPETFTAGQTTWAYAYGSARGSSRGTTVTGNGETVGRGGDLGASIPISVGLRQALGSSVEMSGDVGWLESGLELRVGTPGGRGRWPWTVGAGVRSAAVAIGISDNNPGPTYQGRLRFEIDPLLTTVGPTEGPLRLMLAAGISSGVFEHSIEGPESAGGDVPDFDARFVTTRPEARLELAVGVALRLANADFRFAIAPWILLGAGAPANRCGAACAPVDFSQSWGVSFLLSPSVGGDLIARLTR